jgi:hypothetical protein
MITTDQQGSRLPIDPVLDYKPGDWKFLQPIPSADLANMITSHREVEPALTDWGYFAIRRRDIMTGHPFFAKHPV